MREATIISCVQPESQKIHSNPKNEHLHHCPMRSQPLGWNRCLRPGRPTPPTYEANDQL